MHSEFSSVIRPVANRKSWRRLTTAFCLALLMVTGNFAPLAFGQAATQPAPQREARRIPPTQYTKPRDFDTRHTKLDLRFNWEREQALGTATITFAPLLKDTREVSFDASNMAIQSVRLASGQALQFTNDTTAKKLRVTLDKPYQVNEEVTVVINYNTNGVITDKGILGFGQGLTFIKPTAKDPKRPMQIWSQGESEYNSTWFPTHDHPNDFATSELIATVEPKYTVISNGKLLEKRDNADGTRTWHWKMETPHVSYLTSIIVGEYVPITTAYEGIPITTYVYPNQVEEGKVTAGRLAGMVKFFSEITGVKYPYAKYDQTFVRDFGGGMENITATTLTDNSVVDARQALDDTSDSLISHELAHQWFGDYVTTRTWAHIWLNESFATYFQGLWRQKDLGQDVFVYSDVKANQEEYLQAWNQGNRRPIVTNNYADADALFDAYAYPRGGAVLHNLRMVLGDDAFFRSIQNYLKKHAHQPVVTEQFRIAIEETTGQPMDWFFDQWLYKMGHPILNVTKSFDAAKNQLNLIVKQEQKPDSASAYPQVEFFRLPLDVEIATAAGTRTERITILPQAEQTFTFAVDSNPRFINFDKGGSTIKVLNFERPMSELVYQLQNGADTYGRLAVVDTLKDQFAKADAAGQRQIAEALSTAITKDAFYGVRLEAAQLPAQIITSALAEVVRPALLAATKDSKSLVRAQAIRALAQTKDAKLADTYRNALNDQSYSVIRAAAVALGQTKDASAYDALAKLANTDSFRDQVRGAALGGLAQLGDARALDYGLRYAGAENTNAVRAGAISILGAAGKREARAFPLVSDAFTQSLEDSNFQVGIAAAEALVALGDPRGLTVIRDVRPKIKNPQVQQFLEVFEKRLQGTINNPAPVTGVARPTGTQ